MPSEPAGRGRPAGEGTRASLDYDRILDEMLRWALDEAVVRALWIEGGTPREVRRPYAGLELHVAADEPSFASLLESLPLVLRRRLGASVLGVSDTERLAKEFRARIDALGSGVLDFKVIAEQSSFLPKRPRAEVVPLLDRTGHLTQVMNYSLRRARKLPPQ